MKKEQRDGTSRMAAIGKILGVAGFIASVIGLVAAIIITSTVWRKVIDSQSGSQNTNESGYTEMIDERSPIDYE